MQLLLGIVLLAILLLERVAVLQQLGLLFFNLLLHGLPLLVHSLPLELQRSLGLFLLPAVLLTHPLDFPLLLLKHIQQVGAGCRKHRIHHCLTRSRPLLPIRQQQCAHQRRHIHVTTMLPHRNAALLCHRLNRRVQSDKEKPPKTVHVRGKGAPLEERRAQLRRHCQHALESAWPLRARLPDRGTGLAIQGHVKVSQDCLLRADTHIGTRGTQTLLHEDVLGPDVAVDYSRTCSKKISSKKRPTHIKSGLCKLTYM
mmetsp:Transcript_41150/g.60518  ORF Transcript_41150/g.60518 Transcript_41150/m.60518 type:complete len:256 (-) Transcript_41150:1326-2093(-)